MRKQFFILFLFYTVTHTAEQFVNPIESQIFSSLCHEKEDEAIQLMKDNPDFNPHHSELKPKREFIS